MEWSGIQADISIDSTTIEVGRLSEYNNNNNNNNNNTIHRDFVYFSGLSMTSHVDPTSRTTPGIFLLNMIAREAPHAQMIEHFRLTDPHSSGHVRTVEVKMTINGVEVDFERSVNEMWERLSSSFDAQVLEKAKELLKLTRFSNLEDILQRAEWAIENELERLFPEFKKD